MNERANPISGRLVAGLAVMLLGVLWTLDNLDILESEGIVRWWPLVPLAIGLMKLTGWGMEKSPGPGALLSVIGGLFLLDTLNLANVGVELVFPLLVIFIGVQLTLRAWRGSSASGAAPGEADADDYVRSFAVMGAVTRRNESQAFRGGELSAVMGGVELDLTQAQAAGGRAIVDVFAIWGGIDIRVPEDWRVEVEATPVMAGIESNARLAPGAAATGTLVVRGFVMMGGVEIKNGALGEGRSRVVIRRGRGGTSFESSEESGGRTERVRMGRRESGAEFTSESGPAGSRDPDESR